MTREEFLKQAALLAYRWGAGDSMGAAALDVASLAGEAGLAWDPPTTEQPDRMAADQPPPAEPEAVWSGLIYSLLSDGSWRKYNGEKVRNLGVALQDVFDELARRLLAERDGICPADPDVVHVSRDIWADIADRLRNPLLFVKRGPDGDLESVEVIREPVPTHPTFRQMALVLGRLEAAYLAAQEVGLQAGSLEAQEGSVKGDVRWPYRYDKPPAALRVYVEARVPEGREEESDGQ